MTVTTKPPMNAAAPDPETAIDPHDRLVMRRPDGQWEVKTPHAVGAVLAADSWATAVQWAWNITRDTGGHVLFPRHYTQRNST